MIIYVTEQYNLLGARPLMQSATARHSSGRCRSGSVRLNCSWICSPASETGKCCCSVLCRASMNYHSSWPAGLAFCHLCQLAQADSAKLWSYTTTASLLMHVSCIKWAGSSTPGPQCLLLQCLLLLQNSKTCLSDKHKFCNVQDPERRFAACAVPSVFCIQP